MRQQIPAHARCTHRMVAAARDGAKVTVEVYAGRASDGYKTDHTARPARWIRVRRDRGRVCEHVTVRRYSGRRLERALRDFNETVEDVRRMREVTILELTGPSDTDRLRR